ncbi:MAG: CARDB domain-containing protein [Pseudomonadota bacterium]
MAANLRITDITLEKTVVTTGQHVDFDFTLTNDGDTNVGGSIQTRFYISTDATYQPGDDFVASENTPGMNAGFGAFDFEDFNVPSNLAAGTYYLIGVTDWFDDVAEDNEMDNEFAVPFTVSETPSDFPDIEVSNLSLVTNPVTTTFTGSEMLTVSFDFANNFSHSAEGEFYVYWSHDSYFSPSDVILGDLDFSVAGNVNGNQTFDVDLTANDTQFYGDGYFFVYAELDNTEGEILTGNNFSSGVAASVGTPPPGSSSYGAHVGWYYEIVQNDYTVSTWDYGWYNGGHYAWGTYYGWNLGWFSVPGGWTVGWNLGWHNPGTGWVFGWNVGWYLAPPSWSYGWNVGWYVGWGWNTSGWSVGWHLDTESLFYFSLGGLKLATQDTPYIGWSTTDLGVGIGLSLNPLASGGEHYVDTSGNYQTQQLVLESSSYSWGWVLGPSGWATGWVANATFSAYNTIAEGYSFAGWPSEYASPLPSWDYDTNLGWGLVWGWSEYLPAWFYL